MFFINIIIRFSNCSSSFSFKLSYDVFDLHLTNKVIFNIFRERGANLGSQGEMVLLGKTVCQGYLGNRWAYRCPWHLWRNMGVNFIIICFVCLFLFVVYLTILCPVFVIFIISVSFLQGIAGPTGPPGLKGEQGDSGPPGPVCISAYVCISMCGFARNVGFDWHNAFNFHPVHLLLFPPRAAVCRRTPWKEGWAGELLPWLPYMEHCEDQPVSPAWQIIVFEANIMLLLYIRELFYRSTVLSMSNGNLKAAQSVALHLGQICKIQAKMQFFIWL